jgi:Gpi18-like mannosyltransferase
LWFALSPLILVECIGNLHYEGIMIALVLGTLYFLLRHRYIPSAVFLSLAVATKLTPLIALPFIWQHIGTKHFLKYGAVVFVSTVVLFLPLLNKAVMSNFSTSLDLYFRNFEFNASIYYLLRWVGIQFKGWNWIAVIGPMTSALALLSIMLLLVKKRIKSNQSFITLLVYAFSIHLLFATTVHPWYVCTLVALSCLGKLRYTMVWSFLAITSYHAYGTSGVNEDLWIIGASYTVLLLAFIFECKKIGTNIFCAGK